MQVSTPGLGTPDASVCWRLKYSRAHLAPPAFAPSRGDPSGGMFFDAHHFATAAWQAATSEAASARAAKAGRRTSSK